MIAPVESTTLELAAPEPAMPAAAWAPLRQLPVRLTIDIPLPAMSLRALRSLAHGQLLQSTLPASDDLPVVVGGAFLGWARFECVDDRMLMRVTRLA